MCWKGRILMWWIEKLCLKKTVKTVAKHGNGNCSETTKTTTTESGDWCACLIRLILTLGVAVALCILAFGVKDCSLGKLNEATSDCQRKLAEMVEKSDEIRAEYERISFAVSDIKVTRDKMLWHIDSTTNYFSRILKKQEQQMSTLKEHMHSGRYCLCCPFMYIENDHEN